MKWTTCLALLAVALNSGCDEKSTAAAVSNTTAAVVGETLPEHVTFNAHIRPIFSNT